MILLQIISISVLIVSITARSFTSCTVRNENFDGKRVKAVSFVIPKHRVETEVRLKVTLSYDESLSEEDVANLIEISIKDKQNALRNIASGNSITFLLDYKTTDVEPEVAKVVVNKKVHCKNKDLLDEEYYEVQNVRKTFDLRRRTPSNGSIDDKRSSILERNNYSEASCGSFVVSDGFVHNGERKMHNRWPWVTAIHSSEEFLCSGTFISRTRVVTAAHCIQKSLKVEDLYIKLPKSADDELTEVKSFERHPKYKQGPEYDIAIIDIDPIEDKEFVPICLSDTDDSAFPGRSGSVLSWAPDTTTEDEEDLKGAKFQVTPGEDCNQGGKELPKDAFCVGKSDDGAWLCHGDSGAGFIVKHKNQNYLLGVVSAVITDREDNNCNEEDTVIFTDVSKLISFVTK